MKKPDYTSYKYAPLKTAAAAAVGAGVMSGISTAVAVETAANTAAVTTAEELATHGVVEVAAEGSGFGIIGFILLCCGL